MPANIELKARLRSLASAEEIAQRLGRFAAGLRHVDTYFAIPPERGRLKLREIDGGQAELISYARPDEHASRRSDYHRVPLSPDAAVELKAALSAALGVRQVVVKRRRLYLIGDVRIHLDDVERLGAFLEFEAVLDQPGERLDEAAGHRRLAKLAEAFSIAEEDRIAQSYCDLL
jgi:predicted adenylyl cyclase CyaB